MKTTAMAVDDARAELEEANEAVCQERNSRDGRPSLAAVDRLTDATHAFLRELEKAGAEYGTLFSKTVNGLVSEDYATGYREAIRHVTGEKEDEPHG